jgi:hypothetical protein
LRVLLVILSAICAAPFVVVALFVLVPPLRTFAARLFAQRLARGVERGDVHVIYPNRPYSRPPGGPPPGVIDTTGEDITDDRPSLPKDEP